MNYKAKKLAGEYENGAELYEFRGPGLGYCGTYPTEMLHGGELQAGAIARMLAKAFEAGRQAKAEEILSVLGFGR